MESLDRGRACFWTRWRAKRRKRGGAKVEARAGAKVGRGHGVSARRAAGRVLQHRKPGQDTSRAAPHVRVQGHGRRQDQCTVHVVGVSHRTVCKQTSQPLSSTCENKCAVLTIVVPSRVYLIHSMFLYMKHIFNWANAILISSLSSYGNFGRRKFIFDFP